MPTDPGHKSPNQNEGSKENIRATRALIYLTFFINRLRFKKETEHDRENESTIFTNGDKGFISMFIFEYLKTKDQSLAKEGVSKKVFDIMLASDLADLTEVVGIKVGILSHEHQLLEIGRVENYLNNLSIDTDFKTAMFADYLKYKGSLYLPTTLQEKVLTEEDVRIGRLVKAMKGVSQLLFISNKDKKTKEKILSYRYRTVEIFNQSYLRYIEEFPDIYDIYKILVRLIYKRSHKSENSVTPSSEGAEEFHSMLIQHLSKENLADKKMQQKEVTAENEILVMSSFFYRIKRIYLFSPEVKKDSEQKDSVPEHTFFILFLYTFFIGKILNDPKQKGKEFLQNSADVIFMILSHDLGEILKGDVPAYKKTVDDTRKELEAVEKLAVDYMPDSTLAQKLLSFTHDYEAEKNAEEPSVNIFTFVKALDVLEALLYIFEDSTKAKKANMTIVDLKKYYLKNQKIFLLYPILDRCFAELVNKFS